jgi:5-methylthioadenosine/S-adenosylhomocysteine deaminase
MGVLLRLRHLPDSPFVLAGRVVTMDAKSSVHRDGRVCIRGREIASVAATPADVPKDFQDAPVIETGASIYPGLIELHNHLPYNMLPLWDVPNKYTNRNVWRTQEPKYNPDISWPAKILAENPDKDYPRAIARFAECRTLFGGVTTGEGITVSNKQGAVNYYQGLVRNVEAPDDNSWPVGLGHTLDFKPGEIATELWPALQKPRAYFYHLSEGTDDDARQRFLDLNLGDKWAINQNLVAIHCTALLAGQLARLASSAGMVWSPLSNFLLYGRTSDIAAAKQAGVPIALGSDWSPSGTKNPLGELKIAKIVSSELGGLFTAEELVRMVTSTPARMTQWERWIGSVEVGKRADLVVIDGKSGDPYEGLIAARESDIVAVFIDGRARLGRKDLLVFDPGKQEIVTIGGHDYVLDLKEDTSTPLDGMSLATATAKLTYGLDHMPELGRTFPKILAHALAFAPESTWGLELDYEEPRASIREFLAAANPIDPGQLYPMELAPITEVDDPKFRPALKSNRNIPEFLRAALG